MYQSVSFFVAKFSLVFHMFNVNRRSLSENETYVKLQDMLGNWRISASDPGESLSVFISVQHPDFGDYFTATLKSKRIPAFWVVDHDLFFWLIPHKVAVWIYWHVSELCQR